MTKVKQVLVVEREYKSTWVTTHNLKLQYANHLDTYKEFGILPDEEDVLLAEGVFQISSMNKHGKDVHLVFILVE